LRNTEFFVNTANKLLSVLRLYTPQKSEWTVEEAAAAIGVSVSTSYRYFRNLCKAGLLDPFTGSAYILGPAIIEFDRQIRMNDPMIKVGQPVMKRLNSRSGGMGSLLCRFYRNCVMCIHQEGESLDRNPVSYQRGRPMPMFRGAASKIIFANLPPRTIRSMFERSPRQIAEAGLGSDWKALSANLRKIRKAGVLIARGEVDRGVVGIAAPIFGPRRNVFGSICMVVTQEEATEETIANASALIEAASREIHAGLSLVLGNSLRATHYPMEEPRASEIDDVIATELS
jgi:DNA-binding IclR family transcriptional regulator